MGGHTKSFEFSVGQWVTQNPPANEEIAGHVCVVEFWATWCPPCREQIPHMKNLAKRFQDRNVVFIGLSEDQSVPEVRKFVEKKGINYNIGMDNGLSDRLGVNAIPAAFVISHDGRILWGGNPADSRFEEALESAVHAAPKPLLSGVDLGRFSNLRIKLCGGKNFVKAYSEVESSAKICKCVDKNCDCKIFAAINGKLQEKITAAQQMQEKNPQMALVMYKEIIDNYGGISLTKEIESAYSELQKKTAMRTDSKSIAKAD